MAPLKNVVRLDTANPNSIRQLTDLLNIVYKQRALKGADYLPDGQDEQTTRRRIENREVWVIRLDEQIIGTFAIAPPGTTSYTPWFQQNAVAELSQLAVHPAFRILGIFPILMDAAEQRASELGAVEIAGIAAARQKKLIEAYCQRGYRVVDCKWKKGAAYGTVVFSKILRPPGNKIDYLHLCFRKLKYFRRFVSYRLLSRPHHKADAESSAR